MVAVAVALAVPIQTALASAKAETELETLRFGRGDSLSVMLNRSGVHAVEADRIIKAIQKRTNLRRMSVGREVRLLFRVEGEQRRVPITVSVETRPGRYVEAIRTAKGGYNARRTSIPLAQPVSLSDVAFERDGRTMTVRRNETISGILRRNGVDGETVDAVTGALRASFDPRDLMPGHKIALVAGRDANGAPHLTGVAVYLDDDAAVAVVRTDGGGFTSRRTTASALRAAGLQTAAAPVVEEVIPLQKPTPTREAVETGAEIADQLGAGDLPYDGPQHPVEPEFIELSRTLHSGRTLMDVLLDADVRRPEADALVQSMRRVFNPRRLPAGVTVRVTKKPVEGFEPRIALLDIELPKGRHIVVERGEKGRFSSRITKEPPAPAQARAVAIAAEVDRTEPIAAPATPADALPPSATRITVRSGDTLMAVLRRHGIDRVEADRAIQATRKLFNLRRLRVGQEITLVTGIDETGADTLKAVALRVGDDRYVKVSRVASGYFDAAEVDRLGLMTAPLTPIATVATPPDDKPQRDRASVADRGQVMTGAFVAAAAPFATLSSGLEPQGAADPHGGAVNGTVLPVIKGTVNGTFSDHAGTPLDGDDGLVRKAVVIRSGDTLSVALTRAGGSREEAEAAIVAFREVHNPRKLRVGQTLSLAFEPENGSNGTPRLAALALDVAADRDVVVTRSEDGAFLPSVVDRPLDRVLQRTAGTIDSSLYVSARAAGMPNQVLMEMVHIFSFDVDFQREIQRGNRFEVLYEAVFNGDGEFVENGPILYAKLEVGEREVELFRYEPDEGPADYLDGAGASVRKALMRTPINGARLSSGYGMRKHPILGYNRKHLGVDFAAPVGTPIYAGGDGTITMIGRHGNFGKYVRIRHNSTYSTGYAHLSGYAKGMKKGKRVRQGQVIAYVGSTGMSTGPHLHYEVMRGNKRINPMTLKLPSGRKLKGHELVEFQAQVQKITILLAEVPVVTKLANR